MGEDWFDLYEVLLERAADVKVGRSLGTYNTAHYRCDGACRSGLHKASPLGESNLKFNGFVKLNPLQEMNFSAR